MQRGGTTPGRRAGHLHLLRVQVGRYSLGVELEDVADLVGEKEHDVFCYFKNYSMIKQSIENLFFVFFLLR